MSRQQRDFVKNLAAQKCVNGRFFWEKTSNALLHCFLAPKSLFQSVNNQVKFSFSPIFWENSSNARFLLCFSKRFVYVFQRYSIDKWFAKKESKMLKKRHFFKNVNQMLFLSPAILSHMLFWHMLFLWMLFCNCCYFGYLPFCPSAQLSMLFWQLLFLFLLNCPDTLQKCLIFFTIFALFKLR